MVYLNFVENVITLGKLIGLLFLFCLPLLSILFLKTRRNDLARPVMGTIFLVMLLFVCLFILLYFIKVACVSSECPPPLPLHNLKRERIGADCIVPLMECGVVVPEQCFVVIMHQ